MNAEITEYGTYPWSFEIILLPIEKNKHLCAGIRYLLNKIDLNNGPVIMVLILEKHQLPNDEKR